MFCSVQNAVSCSGNILGFPSATCTQQRIKYISTEYFRSDFFLFGVAAPSGPGSPHSRGFYITHNDAPQSVGLLWTSD